MQHRYGRLAIVIVSAAMMIGSAMACLSSPAPSATPPPTVATATQPPPATARPTAVPTAAEPTAEPTATPMPAPSFSIRPYDAGQDIKVVDPIALVADFEAAMVPGRHRWDVVLAADTSVLIWTGWCAADLPTLDDNWADMEYELLIDDLAVDLAQLALIDSEGPDMVCRSYGGVLTGWSSGLHSYIWTQHIYRDVNDGWDTYPAGDYVNEFAVQVTE